MAVKQCPACERPNNEDLEVCAWCGAALSVKYCPKCDQFRDGVAETCFWCQGPLSEPPHGRRPPPEAASPTDTTRMELQLLRSINNILFWIAVLLFGILVATIAGAYVVYHYAENPY